MEMIYEVRGPVLVAELFGEMDHHASEMMRGNLDSMMERSQTSCLLMDFGRVTFMDSSGIGIVLGRYRKISSSGGHMAVCCCSPKIQTILNMAGVLSVIYCAETKEEALAFLRGKEVS